MRKPYSGVDSKMSVTKKNKKTSFDKYNYYSNILFMFNFDYILGNNIPKQRSDECQKCQNRICCVVYDICSTRNQ